MNKIVLAYRVRRVLLISLSVISKVILALRGSKLSFKKEPSGRWYIVLPWWPGPKAALEMVQGADTFLDLLSDGSTHLTLKVGTHVTCEMATLTKYLDSQIDGAYYETLVGGKLHRMWLCGVTEFVFGKMPKTIGYRVL
jgi:hypothetical protein